MPCWLDVIKKIRTGSFSSGQNPYDVTRRTYLSLMNKYTGRNVIAYYSAFLQKNDPRVLIDDNDINALMQAVYKMDKTKGLDLILHTPGGNIASAESFVTFLKSVFKNDIRVFVPQMAMSAGTMIALSSKEIVMGKESNLGPIDPQFGGLSCGGIIEEFENAKTEIKNSPSTIPLWQTIISQYHPTFLGDCEKAISWSKKMVKHWLEENMFKGNPNAKKLSNKIVTKLSDHSKMYSHSRHIHIEECRKMKINVKDLETLQKIKIDDCEDLQDCVLTIHHAFMETLTNTGAIKIVENHMGNAMISNMSAVPPMQPIIRR